MSSENETSEEGVLAMQRSNDRMTYGPRGNGMTPVSEPIIKSLEEVTLEQALQYLESAEGDELTAAIALAKDRNLLDEVERFARGNEEPEEAEVHHALFMLRRPRGLSAPSFDLMRVQLRRLLAAA